MGNENPMGVRGEGNSGKRIPGKALAKFARKRGKLTRICSMTGSDRKGEKRGERDKAPISESLSEDRTHQQSERLSVESRGGRLGWGSEKTCCSHISPA